MEVEDPVETTVQFSPMENCTSEAGRCPVKLRTPPPSIGSDASSFEKWPGPEGGGKCISKSKKLPKTELNWGRKKRLNEASLLMPPPRGHKIKHGADIKDHQ